MRDYSISLAVHWHHSIYISRTHNFVRWREFLAAINKTHGHLTNLLLEHQQYRLTKTNQALLLGRGMIESVKRTVILSLLR
mmetsp:Transcript_967/g.1959  ORF Transcript_967/g.1959 Transcript_967/m.1959 type:complete len:81 (+) Transcript_967:161-403(+)